MIKNIQKGFTLIELLVVIAIIGILSGILFIAINPSEQTNKAKNTKIASLLSQMRTQANLDWNSDDGFTKVCNGMRTYSPTTYGGVSSSIPQSNSMKLYQEARESGKVFTGSNAINTEFSHNRCYSKPTYFVAWVSLNNTIGTTTDVFCIDVDGFSKRTSRIVPDTSVRCR